MSISRIAHVLRGEAPGPGGGALGAVHMCIVTLRVSLSSRAIARAGDAFRSFMIRQTRETDLAMFADMAGQQQFADSEDIP